MFDAYAKLREAVAAQFCRAGYAADADAVRACATGYELSTALPLKLGLSEADCLARVHAVEAETPAMFDGAPLFAEIAAREGHLCFSLTDAAYGVLMRRVIACAALPELPEETGEPIPYAAARMRMLARRESTGCPDDPAVRRALWLCFGIAEDGISPLELYARAGKAAGAALAMAHGLPPKERPRRLAACGEVGKCTARLLALAVNGQR